MREPGKPAASRSRLPNTTPLSSSPPSPSPTSSAAGASPDTTIAHRSRLPAIANLFCYYSARGPLRQNFFRWAHPRGRLRDSFAALPNPHGRSSASRPSPLVRSNRGAALGDSHFSGILFLSAGPDRYSSQWSRRPYLCRSSDSRPRGGNARHRPVVISLTELRFSRELRASAS